MDNLERLDKELTMDERKKQYKDLMKKKIGDLRKIAESFSPPITLKPKWTKDKIAKLIMQRRITAVAKIIDKVQVQDRKEKKPINTEFEQKAAEAAEPNKEKRGGVRPESFGVSGRTLGMTDVKAKVKNLPKYPSIPIKQGSEELFDLWASVAKIEELALSEDEAVLLSLPITQLAEYYFPGMIPEIAGTWVMMIFAVTRIMKPRIKLVEEVRKLRREAGDIKAEPAKPAKDDGRTFHYKRSDNNQPIHALAAGEPVLFTNDLDKVNCIICRNIISNASLN